ncbi:hypothetical protein ACJMK2_033263 [Sinanodonta woodiana]|uniref:Mitochondria-eating protein C-terminal domain-containing protein n=1 Tax=Sinanodonta woodiana TaxID=1069815 RepID=A0ABD3X889_SINWO
MQDGSAEYDLNHAAVGLAGNEVRSELNKNEEELLKSKEERKKLEEENQTLLKSSKLKDDLLSSKSDEINRLIKSNSELRSKLTQGEAERTRVVVENQVLQQKIAMMEETQKTMSKGQPEMLINDAETKVACTASTACSVRNTDKVDVLKRLSQTEARLSLSLDENKQLREDLKDMLETHIDLQSKLADSGTLEGESLLTNSENKMMMSSRRTKSVGAIEIQRELVHQQASVQTEAAIHGSEAISIMLKRLELEYAQLQNEYEQLQHSFEDLLNRLQDAEEKQAKSILEKQNEIWSKGSEALERTEVQHGELRKSITCLDGLCRMLQSRIEKLENDNKCVSCRGELLHKHNSKQKTEVDKVQKDMKNLREENDNLLKDNRRLLDELKNKTSSDNDSLRQEFADIKHKYEEAQQRLSIIAAESLSRGDYRILSIDEKNSPIKLAEEFRCDLYGNDWCDAYLMLTAKLGKDERKATQILLDLCTESYLFVKRCARYQLDTVYNALLNPSGNNFRSGQRNSKRRNGDDIPELFRQQIISVRMQPSADLIASLMTDFLEQFEYERSRHLRSINQKDLHEISPYISKCVRLSWRMAVQEPPMYLLFKIKRGTLLDKTKFDVYTVNGELVDFLVWPAVLKGEHGECLQKGVIQPLNAKV